MGKQGQDKSNINLKINGHESKRRQRRINRQTVQVHTAEVRVRYDEPHQWGNQSYKDGWAFARLCDDFGSLRHLEIIDDRYQTLRVRFTKSIAEIDRMFARDYKSWGAVNLKEWIDSYESSRFTLVAYDMAVITSEYNMAHIEEWLRKNTPILSIENTI